MVTRIFKLILTLRKVKMTLKLFEITCASEKLCLCQEQGIRGQ